MKKILCITTFSLISQFCLAMNSEKHPKVGQKRKQFHDFLNVGQIPKSYRCFLENKPQHKKFHDFLKIEYSLTIEQKPKKNHCFLGNRKKHKKLKVLRNFLGIEQDEQLLAFFEFML